MAFHVNCGTPRGVRRPNLARLFTVFRVSRGFVYFFAVTLLVGCATTKEGFYANRAGAKDTNLCRAHKKAKTGEDAQFTRDVGRELARRGINEEKCTQLIRTQDLGIVGGIIIGIGAAVLMKSGGGGGNAYSGGGTDWDQFYDQYGNLTWRCREVNTGQFAYDYQCANKVKSDWRWPGK